MPSLFISVVVPSIVMSVCSIIGCFHLFQKRGVDWSVSIGPQPKKRTGLRDVAMVAGQRVAPRQARTALLFSRRIRSLSEIVISHSLGVEWRRKWLPIAWLATWGLAVMSAAVPYWWVIGLLAIAFWELTWQMSGTDKVPILSLGRKKHSNSMGDVCGDYPLRAVLELCAELESARPRKGTCRKGALVGTHLSNNRRALLSRPDV